MSGNRYYKQTVSVQREEDKGQNKAMHIKDRETNMRRKVQTGNKSRKKKHSRFQLHE